MSFGQALLRQYAPSAIAALLLLAGALFLSVPKKYPDLVQDYGAAWARWHRLEPNGVTSDLLDACCPGQFAPSQPDAWPAQTAHPPFATTLVLPLALLPWSVARVVWLLINWLAIVIGWRLIRAPVFVQLATAMWWIEGLAMGAFEPLVFLCIAAAIRLADRTEVRAGLLIGLAAGLKIYPAVLIGGIWISGRRAMAVGAFITGGITLLLGEVALGRGATAGWLAYMPINTSHFIDMIYNLSLPHLLRTFIPAFPPFVATLLVLLGLSVPLLTSIRRRRSWESLVPVMLLASPLCWVQYLPLVTLGQVSPLVLGSLALSGLVSVLAIFDVALVPAGVPFAVVVLVLPTLALLLTWYQQLGRGRSRALYVPRVEAGKIES